MQTNKYLIVLAGATGSGKTALGIRLAKSLQTVIVSADSRQFYREMSIGTAKATPQETAQVKHYFSDSHSIHQPLSVGDYEKEAMALLHDLFQKHDSVLLVGGTGLYIKALCEGLDEFPEVSEALRSEVETELAQKGITALQEELELKDPDYYQTIDLHNPHRLIRAISVIRASGQPFSTFLNQTKAKRPFQVIYLCLQINRERLYERINQRVDQMLVNGLLEEVKALQEHQPLQALQTVGYRELFDYFSGIHSFEKAVELIKRNSRRYAKRQMTWFRRDPHWFYAHSEQLNSVEQYLQMVMEQSISIVRANSEDSDAIQAFYTEQGENQKMAPNHQVLIAKKEAKIIAAVQFGQERKVQILHTCTIASQYRNMGLLQLLLIQLEHQLSSFDLYAIASINLSTIYQTINLSVITAELAPSFLQERLKANQATNFHIYHRACKEN